MLTVRLETVKLVDPEFVKVPVLVVFCPIATLPKLRFGGTAATCPAVTAWPDTIKVVEACVLVEMATTPEGLPAPWGMN